jgi:hypothetical protein
MFEDMPIDLTEWCLYYNQRDTPRQSDHDCDLYNVMFGMSVSMRLPLSLITKARIKSSQVLLLLHLIDLQPERAKPLGEGGEYTPKGPRPPFFSYSPKAKECSSPETPLKELKDKDKGGLVFTLMTPLPKKDSAANQPSTSVLDLITPEKTAGGGNEKIQSDTAKTTGSGSVESGVGSPSDSKHVNDDL